MLSNDEINNGMTFILQLQSTAGAAGVPVQWVETLRGDTARRWYDIYRSSDWEALRAEAEDVFPHRVDDAELRAVRKQRSRSIFIHTPAVTADQLAADPGPAERPAASC